MLRKLHVRFGGGLGEKAKRTSPACLPYRRWRRLSAGVRVSAGTSRHSGEGCKSQTVKVQPTTLAPSHAQASATVSAKR